MNVDQSQPYWTIVNVEAAILKDGHYLMIVRGKEESHAAGVLTLVGGKVEHAGNTGDILEVTLCREVREEVAVEMQDDLEYFESNLAPPWTRQSIERAEQVRLAKGW